MAKLGNKIIPTRLIFMTEFAGKLYVSHVHCLTGRLDPTRQLTGRSVRYPNGKLYCWKVVCCLLVPKNPVNWTKWRKWCKWGGVESKGGIFSKIVKICETLRSHNG
ncbi:hypothetical protein H106_05389 [Trichophyton rubrum CBS 735.88]|nr:hypothetical protein H110_05547 [Trichophyton rubrum MR1448]EZG04469.1 hypothetical protein H106_05389 [Trichophyton rubrum CBS 735.88]